MCTELVLLKYEMDDEPVLKEELTMYVPSATCFSNAYLLYDFMQGWRENILFDHGLKQTVSSVD